MNASDLLLVSYELCPYVQRSVIILNEKNISYTREYIDLDSPPIWFNEKSPLGKVPLLVIENNHAIFESAAICEYLDEITPGELLPVDPIKKASHRAWIEFGSQMLNDIGALYSSKSALDYESHAVVIRKKIKQLESEIETPYYSGDKFMMIDAVYATVFRYFDVLEKYLLIDVFESCIKVKKWRKNLSEYESVINGVKSDYSEKLLEFLINKKSYISSVILN
ncbi:MAG: glutathione S-transferase family protein [Bacteroidota bacterium]